MSFLKSIFGGGSKYKTANSQELTLELQATLAYENGQVQQSISMFTEGIKKYPINPYFYYLRGNAKEDLQKWDDAITDFEQYLKINPGHYNALFRIGLCYQNSKRYSQALNFYNQAEKNYEMFMPITDEIQLLRDGKISGSYYSIPKEKIFLNRAIVKSNLQDYQGAINDCTTAIKINPKYSNPYFVRAMEYLRSNKKVEAKKDLETASSLGYKQADALIIQFFNEEDPNEAFFKQVIEFAESPQAKMMGGGRNLRFGFETDLSNNLHKYGLLQNISTKVLVDEASDYLLDMLNEFKHQAGTIDDFLKAFIAYEVSQAIKRLRNDIDQKSFWLMILQKVVS